MLTQIDYKNSLIKDIVALNFKNAEIFEQYGIDFCCKGNRPVKDACEDKGLVVDEVVEKLQSSEQDKNTAENFDEWDLDFLADYIKNKHHTYVRKAIPLISEHLDRVVNAHGPHHPYVLDLNRLFLALSDELASHMMKEEKILFPAIKRNMAILRGDIEGELFHVANPIQVMEAEHSNAGEILEKIRSITDNFTPPADACMTFKVTYKELNEFEEDLHKHIFLENGILFPKAIALEENK